MKKLLLCGTVSVVILFNVSGQERWYPLGFPLFKVQAVNRQVEIMGQSFMFTRPVFSNVAARQASFWHVAEWERLGCWGGSIEVVPIHQQNLASPQNARYFFIDHQETLVIKGDNVPPLPVNPNTRNIRAEWLNLPDTFFGTVSIKPQQKQFGLWVEWNQKLRTFFHHEFFKNLWFGFAFPFQTVTNNVRVSQDRFSEPTGTFPDTSIEAFNRGNMIYAKLKPTKTEIKGVGEVHFKMGTTFMDRDGFVVGLYSSLIAPTTGAQRAEFLFDPFLGHNGNWGFGTGIHFELPLNCDIEKRLITFFMDIENLFFLRNYQNRTFDLRDKPFSRYMLLVKNDGTTNIPAANILTRRVKINPFNFVDMVAGFRAQVGIFEFEVGYNLWAHPDEEIILAPPFPKGYGIQGVGTLPGTIIPATASKSTINNLAANDTDFFTNAPVFVEIKEFDLDFNSAIARAAVAHRASFAFGVIHDECVFALFWGIGGFIEIPQQNTALKNWGVWGKIGGSF